MVMNCDTFKYFVEGAVDYLDHPFAAFIVANGDTHTLERAATRLPVSSRDIL